MNLTDFLSHLSNVTSSSENQHSSICPGHEDTSPSLSIGYQDEKILLQCHAGCTSERIVQAMGLELSDLFSSPSGGRGGHFVGPSVADLAAAKSLPIDFLESLGLENSTWERRKNNHTYSGTCVLIPYHYVSGALASRHRRRKALEGQYRFDWTGNTTENGSPLPYGLNRLQAARDAGYIIMVEGESDCWALWHHGYPALGIPGSKLWKSLQLAQMKDIATVYIIQEPDDGGEAFVQGGIKRFSGWKNWKGDIRIVTLESEDASELHIQHSEKFNDLMGAAMDAAVLRGVSSHLEPPPAEATSGGSMTPKDDPIAATGRTGGRPRTDSGNSERLVDLYGSELKFCWELKRWLAWDETRWNGHLEESLQSKALRTIRNIWTEVRVETDSGNLEAAEALSRFAVRSESLRSLRAMVDLARGPLSCHQQHLDRNPWYLNVLNGTFDLKTGEFHDHNQAHGITKLAPVEYVEEAECPRWLLFLDRVLDQDQELIRFVQQAIGYSLTADTSEECLFILHGSGRNGKTKFLEVIRSLLGDYAQTTPTSTLIDQGRYTPSQSSDVARLKGIRFVTASETDEGHRLAEGQVKSLTGGDVITARYLYGEFFDFRPVCKIWLSCNHRPRIRGTDEGVWSRIRLIPFNITIPEEERDSRLLEKLLRELPGILNWALQGCRDWVESGELELPKSMKLANREYRSDMDILGKFIEDCCLEDELHWAPHATLFTRYRNWCQITGETPSNSRNFGLKLFSRGLIRHKGAGGARGWKGLSLKSEDELTTDGADLSDSDGGFTNEQKFWWNRD